MNNLNKILLLLVVLLVGALGYVLHTQKDMEDQTSQIKEVQEMVKEEAVDEVMPVDDVEAPGVVVKQETTKEGSLLDSEYLDSYTLTNDTYGTSMEVTVGNGVRFMKSNALANHETGQFPGPGNPNEISAQNDTYEFPLTPVFTGTPQFAREPGVAINGIKFEPQTAERVNCSTGEEYAVEAIQDVLDLGLDMNNAHVQPTGAYHYHGTPTGLVDSIDEKGKDLLHVGFARDGHLIYYSKSGAYDSSYVLSNTKRSGTGCVMTGPGNLDVVVSGTSPDGTYGSDWIYDKNSGDLDECNGVVIEGQYVYLITDEFPYIGRCLMGEFEEELRGPGGGQESAQDELRQGGGPRLQQGPPTQGQRPPRQ